MPKSIGKTQIIIALISLIGIIATAVITSWDKIIPKPADDIQLVPGVVGRQYSDALAELKALGFNVERQDKELDGQPEGTVIDQLPSAGTEQSQNTTVYLTVAKQPEWEGLPSGVYTIQQKSNGRYVDAHQSSNNDYCLVTRLAQDNDTQRWILMLLGNNTYTMQQMSNGRYVDAHQSSNNDYRLVTRPAQNSNTQRWILTLLGNNTYTMQQKSNGRYVDAHEGSNKDYHLVTRPAQNNDTQRWLIKGL